MVQLTEWSRLHMLEDWEAGSKPHIPVAQDQKILHYLKMEIFRIAEICTHLEYMGGPNFFKIYKNLLKW